MKVILNIVVATGCVIYLSGCSQAENQPDSPSAAVSETATQAQPTSSVQPPPPEATVNLENVNVALQEQDYETAVDILVQAKGDPQYLTDSARLALYLQQERAAAEALAQAMNSDPKARAAYERLRRATMGR